MLPQLYNVNEESKSFKKSCQSYHWKGLFKKWFNFYYFQNLLSPCNKEEVSTLVLWQFCKRLNEPLQVTEFYDKTSNEQKGYSKDNAPLGVLYLFADDNTFLII